MMIPHTPWAFMAAAFTMSSFLLAFQREWVFENTRRFATFAKTHPIETAVLSLFVLAATIYGSEKGTPPPPDPPFTNRLGQVIMPLHPDSEEARLFPRGWKVFKIIEPMEEP